MTSSLHICYIESEYPRPGGGGGGAGTYVQLVGRELIRRGHNVSVVAGWYPGCIEADDDNGVQVYRPRIKKPFHWYVSKVPGMRAGALSLRYLECGWAIYRFLERLRELRPVDVAEFTEGGDYWHAVRPSFPYLTHLHGSRYTFRRMAGRQLGSSDWYHRRLELMFIRRANLAISPSQAMLECVEEEAGCVLPAAQVLPYPLDPRMLAFRRTSLSRENGRKVVLFAARNDPVKGADILLRAIPRVRREFPNVEFRFFGYEANRDAAQLEGVYYFPFVPKTELLQQYSRADLCIVPSVWDNSPNTVYEAMAAGVAVIASRVGGIPELVQHGVTGLLFPPGKDVALAEAIIELLGDDRRRTIMGREGQMRIRRLSDIKSNVTNRLRLYETILNSA